MTSPPPVANRCLGPVMSPSTRSSGENRRNAMTCASRSKPTVTRWNTATSDPTPVSLSGPTDHGPRRSSSAPPTAMPIKPGRSRMNWHTSSWGTWALRNTTSCRRRAATMEVEAESVAYVISRRYGMEPEKLVQLHRRLGDGRQRKRFKTADAVIRLPTTSQEDQALQISAPEGMALAATAQSESPSGPRRSPRRGQVEITDPTDGTVHLPAARTGNFGTAPDRPVLGHRRTRTRQDGRGQHRTAPGAPSKNSPRCAANWRMAPQLRTAAIEYAATRTARQRCSAATSSRLPPNNASKLRYLAGHRVHRGSIKAGLQVTTPRETDRKEAIPVGDFTDRSLVP